MLLSRPMALVGSSLLLLLSLVPVQGFAPVEPFLGAWCAELFPLNVVDYNGLSMARINKNHIPLEPYLGEWCFRQFPTELTAVNRTLAVAALYQHHVDFEPFLKDWSDQATGNLWTPTVDLEPYVGQWCTLSFPQQLARLQATVTRQVADQHVDLEPSLVHWCREQFAPEFTEPITDETLEQLDFTYLQVENQIMGWTLTLVAVPKIHSLPQSTSNPDVAIAGLVVALVLAVLALFCTCMCLGTRRLCSRVSDNIHNNHNNKTNEFVDTEQFTDHDLSLSDHDLSLQVQQLSQPVHA